MRILFVSSAYRPEVGGLEILCEQLLRELRRRGHTVAYVTGRSAHASAGTSEWDGVPVLRIDVTEAIESRDPAALLRLRRDIRTFVDELAPDVVHAHDVNEVLPMVRLFARALPPVLHTFHTVVSRYLPDLPPKLIATLAQADRATAVSEPAAIDIQRLVPDLSGRTAVVPNGIAAATHEPEPPDESAPFICVGRLAPEKDIALAIDAMAIVAEHHPDARLVVAGDGVERAALITQVRARRLERNIDLIGTVEHDRVEALLQDARALVMPSRVEGLPLVALEAARVGRCVVGSDIPGLRALIDDGVTGLLFAPGDAAALAGCLLRLVDEPGLAGKLGDAAHREVGDGWDLARCADAYEEIYLRLAPAAAG